MVVAVEEFLFCDKSEFISVAKNSGVSSLMAKIIQVEKGEGARDSLDLVVDYQFLTTKPPVKMIKRQRLGFRSAEFAKSSVVFVVTTAENFALLGRDSISGAERRVPDELASKIQEAIRNEFKEFSVMTVV